MRPCPLSPDGLISKSKGCKKRCSSLFYNDLLSFIQKYEPVIYTFMAGRVVWSKPHRQVKEVNLQKRKKSSQLPRMVSTTRPP